MTLNACELWSNGIKIDFFFQKNNKKSLKAGSFAPRPVCDTFELR